MEDLEREVTTEATNTEATEEVAEVKEPVVPTFTKAEVDEMLANARKEAEEIGYKNSQRVINKKDKEINRLKQSGNSKIDRLLSFFEEDAAKDEFGNEKAKKLRDLRTTLSQEDKLSEAKAIMDEINTLASENKVSLNDPEFRHARVFYQSGNFKEAIEEVNDVINRRKGNQEMPEKKTPANLSDEDIQKIKEEAKAEAEKEFRKKYNLDKQDNGGSDSVTSDFKTVRENYINNPNDKSAQIAYMKARKDNGI